ncbi:hypothetical protein [Luteibacter sp. UNCMF331Sha3.1]|uniref:hypothetical protein n=1 Tax=Luteibacter sp. UNCMF331Sha3.1 TaxID=1502760 RepID=UPI001FCD0028|nr:hypothetical protein [Luteibacter sp. UNCMF331Sha3.1]
MRAERGAILVVVLAVLAMLSILGAAMSVAARARMLAAKSYLCVSIAGRDATGGEPADGHATIDGGATGASSTQGFHGSQTVSPGGDDRFRHGIDDAGFREGRSGCTRRGRHGAARRVDLGLRRRR